MIFVAGFFFGLAIGALASRIDARKAEWFHVAIFLALGVFALFSA